MKAKRNSWLVAVLIVGILCPLIFVSTSLQPWQGEHGVGPYIQVLVYPFEYLWFATSDVVNRTWTTYVALSNAAEENLALRRKLEEIRSRTIDYDEQSLEITRLRQLLGFAQHYDRRLLVAEVIGSLRTAPFYALRLSRGDNHGIKVGMPVVTADGVVGKIIRTGDQFADVQLLTDSNFHIDILVQRTRVRGVLRGISGSRCLLSLHQKAEIRIGDTLVTSGIVGSFPKGLPVGRVVKISYEADNVSQIITVDPWVDYRRVEEVFVVESEDRELAKIVETVGFEWLEKSLKGSDAAGGG